MSLVVSHSIRENIKDYQSALIAMGQCCMLSKAIEQGKEWDYFERGMIRKDPYDELNFVRKDEAGAIEGGLKLDFKQNRLVTCFKGQQQEAPLSSTLSNILELGEIFAVVQERMSKELPAITDQFAKAISAQEEANAIEKKEKDAGFIGYKLLIDGQEVIKVINNRVVLNKVSSIPCSQIQYISHLFDRNFAETICPLLGQQTSIDTLMLSIRRIYLGRRLLGVKYAKDGHTSHGAKAIKREFQRIVNQIRAPGSDFHTMPIV